MSEALMGPPRIAARAWVHASAVVVGDVVLQDDVSVWPTAVIRGDRDRITIGEASNVQDGAVLHADPGVPCTIGARVTIGHRAVVHGATVEDGALIGIGAIVLNGAVVGAGALVAAGAVVPEGMVVPAGVLVRGVPAKVVGALDAAQQARVARGWATYVELKDRYAGSGASDTRGWVDRGIRGREQGLAPGIDVRYTPLPSRARGGVPGARVC